MSLRLAEVEWEDAASTDICWTAFDELDCCTERMVSIGYILKYTNTHISLVQNMHFNEEDRCYSHVINIPISCVHAIHMLERSVKVTNDLQT